MTDADDRTTSPLRWGVLALAAIAIFCSYYESDAIGPIADLLGRQRGFTQSQIGDLTAVISLPNILLAVFNGLLIDRYGPARVTLWAAVIGFVGAVLTAIGTPYELMWTGRLVFGVSEGAIFISLVAAIARWFSRSGIALATAIFLCLARVGSFSLDTSPSWARSLYDAGWQPPLWLGAAITGAGLVAAVVFRLLDSAHAPPMFTGPGESAHINWRGIWKIDLSHLYILGLLADRFGHRAMMLTVGTLLQNVGLWGSNRIAGWLADKAGAGPAHPEGYATMIWFFGLLSLAALTSVLLLWQRERGPKGHGLEVARVSPAPRVGTA